jgi:hypothetical protein
LIHAVREHPWHREARLGVGSTASRQARTGRLLALAVAATVLLVQASEATQHSWADVSTTGGVALADITLTKTADLSFGELVAGGSAGTVVVTPAGARSSTGGVTLGNSAGAAAASFTVGGTPGATYSVTLPIATSLASGAHIMIVDTFTSSPTGTGQLSGAGAQTLAVGGTLQVGASQASGSYNGFFSVIVTYN